MTTRLNKRQREQKRRQREADVERDAEMLPKAGPIADLVARIRAVLDHCVVAGLKTPEAVATLHPLGVEAFEAVGSIRGMRAICQKASTTGQGQPQARNNLLCLAWAGIGDDHGTRPTSGEAQHVATR